MRQEKTASNIGIIRRIDDLGRIVIPKEIRRYLSLKEGSPMEIFLNEEGVFLKPYNEEHIIISRLTNLETDLDEFISFTESDYDKKHIMELFKKLKAEMKRATTAATGSDSDRKLT